MFRSRSDRKFNDAVLIQISLIYYYAAQKYHVQIRLTCTRFA